MNDTICAISTTLGVGAISIVRVSGKEAIEKVNNITNIDLTKKKSHTISYAYIKDNNEIIDEVLISIMKAPKTFTTEDTVEINCHGGIATTEKVLELLLKQGIRLAETGEFTKRAFLNGRIDLTEAEAVNDLINTKTDKARKIVINNLKGTTSNKIRKLRERLVKIINNIEVNIDYPEYQDIEEMTVEKIKEEIGSIEEELESIITNSENSKIITNGINIAIIGRPNVGKSSILNKLIEEDKAIVTNIPGTTRDIVEASFNLNGITLNLIDTAGIRETEDIVEQIGVKKSKEALEKADLVLLILNNNEKLTKEDKELLEISKNKKRIIVVNKTDLEKKLDIKDENIVYTNTIEEKGIEELLDKISELYKLEQLETNDFYYVSTIEQLNKIKSTRNNIKDIKAGLKENISIDMLEIDLREIWQTLGEVIGETYTEELLDNLFKNFCVGK
ncbi:MAG: tRNA uridine-5-carboxymethylaminomethyl(34) synthesis GTPase MnmE [Bacilli bacterium]|nr:tRNA uridine-5-carboxymethylaminomethyl(34) synthesis GTPase MnmE [Bacilli bacterium]